MVTGICAALVAVPLFGIVPYILGFEESDPCLSASLVANSTSINDIIYILGDAMVVQEFEPMKLDFSSEAGICGPVAYSVSRSNWESASCRVKYNQTTKMP
jgi:hypothetical protein